MHACIEAIKQKTKSRSSKRHIGTHPIACKQKKPVRCNISVVGSRSILGQRIRSRHCHAFVISSNIMVRRIDDEASTPCNTPRNSCQPAQLLGFRLCSGTQYMTRIMWARKRSLWPKVMAIPCIPGHCSSLSSRLLDAVWWPPARDVIDASRDVSSLVHGAGQRSAQVVAKRRGCCSCDISSLVRGAGQPSDAVVNRSMCGRSKPFLKVGIIPH